MPEQRWRRRWPVVRRWETLTADAVYAGVSIPERGDQIFYRVYREGGET